MKPKKNTPYENPKWPNKKQYEKVIRNLNAYPNLVFPNEIIDLRSELIEVSNGKKFIIQGRQI